jgi:hypothetical protein
MYLGIAFKKDDGVRDVADAVAAPPAKDLSRLEPPNLPPQQSPRIRRGRQAPRPWGGNCAAAGRRLQI